MDFQPQKNLPKDTLFTAKDMGYKDRESAAMKRLLQDQKIARVLDKPEERREFYTALKERAGKNNSVKKDDVRKVLGDLRSGRGKNIDKGEAQKLAGEFFRSPMEKKYIFTQEEKKNNPVVNPRGGSSLAAKMGSSSRKGPSPRLKF